MQDFFLMLLFNELKDCLFFFFNNNVSNKVERDSHTKYQISNN